jgi:hypothetical protein
MAKSVFGTSPFTETVPPTTRLPPLWITMSRPRSPDIPGNPVVTFPSLSKLLSSTPSGLRRATAKLEGPDVPATTIVP